jgi:DNA recombination protein RmuC
MHQPIFDLDGAPVTLGDLATIAVFLLAVIFFLLLIAGRRRRRNERSLPAMMEARIAELVRTQGEISGKMKTMAEIFGSRQAELMSGLSQRFDGLSQNLGKSLSETTKNTTESIGQLNARIAVIDKAQQTITTLSSQVVQLQQILANKQTRGAFGEGRMQAIVQDGLAHGSYEFQATLSNGTRPDCIIRLPNGASGLVVDAKFPLEAWSALRAANGPEAARVAEAQFKRDLLKHIQDIATRYLIPGETQDTAFMFVPSESIFADIHERFEDVVQKAHRMHIVIVSPSLLMLSIQVVQSLLRDSQMRQQAHIIQSEVVKLIDDVGRLDERVRKLQAHFSQATSDVEAIVTSSRKITARGERIKSMEVEENETAPPVAPPLPLGNELPAQLPFRQIEEA